VPRPREEPSRRRADVSRTDDPDVHAYLPLVVAQSIYPLIPIIK
jgi:hypothetical protein